jgi:hypothetical protein
VLTVPSRTKTDTGRQPRPGMLTPDDANPPPGAQKERRGTDIIVARAFADLATLSIVQHRASAQTSSLNEQLSGALTSRIVIEQAKGVLAERAGVDLAEAFSRLRAYARNSNLRLTDVARAAIDGTLDPAAWAPPARPVPS